jgi:hypothetical protein
VSPSPDTPTEVGAAIATTNYGSELATICNHKLFLERCAWVTTQTWNVVGRTQHPFVTSIIGNNRSSDYVHLKLDRPVRQSRDQPPPHVAWYVAFSSSLIPVTGTPIRA